MAKRADSTTSTKKGAKRRVKGRKNVAARPSVAEVYLAYCRRRLVEEYFSNIKKCLEVLDESDVWWRGHETDNSIGNLLLHISGNIRQWIISGMGGAADVRDRPLEFSERHHIPKEELLKLFEGTINQADRALEKFDPGKFLEVHHFQKWDTTHLDALSHVVEHVSQHVGQIIYITKLRKGKDLRLVDV